jgi:hypothetical protein
MHGRDGHDPIAVVMHIAEGPMSAIDSWFTNPASEASAHYAIAKDGSITQYVQETDAAWANGQVRAPSWPLLIAGINPNLYTISIETEGKSGEPWTDAMLNSAIWLIRDIASRWSIPLDEQHIIGHCEIDSVTRANCPGTGVPWFTLLDELKHGGTMITNPFKRGMIAHIGPNGEYPLGRPEHWVKWTKEIIDMGFDGVKGLVFESASDIDKQPIKALRYCLDAGLVVVARLYRERPNPGVLTAGQLKVAELLVKLGIVLQETNNELNLLTEWQNNDFGQMAREVGGRNCLADLKAIVNIGGCPAIPAMAPGGNLDDMWFLDGMLTEIKKGITPAILNRTWFAIHNYTLNHPLDYPDDDVNRHGTQLTEQQYRDAGTWELPLDQVNAKRREGMHATGSIMDAGESNGWRKPEAVHALGEKHFGMSIPCISTEGLVVMDRGFSNDPRYPLVLTEYEHAAIASECAQRMMRNKVPSYYWALCAWVMANRMMENPVTAGFEAHSWYPYYTPNGIATVETFKAMPKRNRYQQEAVITDEQIRTIGQAMPSAVSLNPVALLYKALLAADAGQIETSEWLDTATDRLFQKAQWDIGSCRASDLGDVRVVPRTDNVKP